MENHALTDIVNSLIGRRIFFKKLALLTAGAGIADCLYPIFIRSSAFADIIAGNDQRLINQEIYYKGSTGNIRAIVSRPKKDAKMPGVVVIHENRGLNAHISDVGRRIAVEGFITLAPDALSPVGGTPSDENKAVSLINQLDQESTVKNLVAAVQYLKTLPESTGKVGVVGFCWGGAMANQLAVNSPDLSAAVAYYGRQPAIEDVPKIKASLLLHYAGVDDMINGGINAYEEALKKSGVDYRLFMYEGAQHAFNNDTNAQRYNKQAADLAWKRTIDFFKEKLKT